MNTIQVSLNTNDNPPVTCSPAIADISETNEEINWVMASDQTFTFESLHFKDDPPCFSEPVVTADEITVTDENDNSNKTYPYIVNVILDGKVYSSRKSEPGEGDGSPSICNK
jgi:hypothetical protein